MANYITFKAPRARKEESYIVYPFTTEDTKIKIQSDKRVAIIDLETKTWTLSKSISSHPTFYHLAHEAHVAQKNEPVPANVWEQAEKIVNENTATTRTVTLVG